MALLGYAHSGQARPILLTNDDAVGTDVIAGAVTRRFWNSATWYIVPNVGSGRIRRPGLVAAAIRSLLAAADDGDSEAVGELPEEIEESWDDDGLKVDTDKAWEQSTAA
jgi:hypothetical protein